jgi:hypothetical protein
MFVGSWTTDMKIKKFSIESWRDLKFYSLWTDFDSIHPRIPEFTFLRSTADSRDHFEVTA